jgi:hypothetical protein
MFWRMMSGIWSWKFLGADQLCGLVGSSVVEYDGSPVW